MAGKTTKSLDFNNIVRLAQRAIIDIQNQQRARANEAVDYVTLTLPAEMPLLPENRNPVLRAIQGDPPLSITDFERIMRRIGDDPRPQGVILHLRGFEMPLADLQNLRNIIKRLREKGKRVICYGHYFNTGTYYVAAAADEVVVQPAGLLDTTGINAGVLFLKDALNYIGVEVEAIQITPYKSALDRLARSEISDEAREQLDWLLDARFDDMIEGIAADRDMTLEAVREMIDTAPHTVEEAKEAGYIDALENEETLTRRLNSENIITWKKADKVLYDRVPRVDTKYVALLKVTGAIVDGESSNRPVDPPIPLFGGEQTGDLTVVQAVRRVMNDENAAAVILMVDSGGGSASSSEAMAAALDELAKTRPVVVYMNNVAASGGYYVSTPARWIVAQSGTITGSIGVLSGKIVTQPLFEKLRINRTIFNRGENAGIMGDDSPLTDAQRQKLRTQIEQIYKVFIGRVAESRNMDVEAVDKIGGGRVWTGKQALEHGLVDELGDLRTALDKARELAKLPDDAPLVIPRARRPEPLAAQLAEQMNPAAGITRQYKAVRNTFNGRAQVIMPFTIDD